MFADIDKNLTEQLFAWYMRKTTNSAVRRVSSLPIAVATDIGLVREENQDRVSVMRYTSGGDYPTIVVVLSDGMGGMVDGASSAALSTSAFFSACLKYREQKPKERMQAAALYANEAVFGRFKGRGGATLSAVVIEPTGKVFGIHVGDSRIYIELNSSVLQISEDDTVAAVAQKYNAEQVDIADRFKHELVQFIGQGDELEPHLIDFSGELPNKIMLTSDGAHSIGDANLFKLVNNSSNQGLAVKRILELSNWFGGKDNASAVSIDCSVGLNQQPGSPNLIELWDPFGELQCLHFPSVVKRINETTNARTVESATVEHEKVETLEVKNVRKKRGARQPKKEREPSNKSKENKLKKDREKIVKDGEDKASQLDILFGENSENNKDV